MAGMGKFLKQAQKMQSNMMRIQEELKEKTVEATSGGGVIKVIASCDKKIKAIDIDPSILEDKDVEMLQDLIVSSVNLALEEADRVSNDELGKVTQGFNMPGMPGLGL